MEMMIVLFSERIVIIVCVISTYYFLSILNLRLLYICDTDV